MNYLIVCGVRYFILVLVSLWNQIHGRTGLCGIIIGACSTARAFQIEAHCNISLAAKLTVLIGTPSIQATMRSQSSRMSLARRDLDYNFLS